MLLQTVFLDLMKHATKTRFEHGSHSPPPLLLTSHLTCHLYRLLSSDPEDQSRLDMEVLNFRKQAYAPSTKTTYKSQLRAYLLFCAYYGYQPLPYTQSLCSFLGPIIIRFLNSRITEYCSYPPFGTWP